MRRYLLGAMVAVPAGVAVHLSSGPRNRGTDAVEDQSRRPIRFAPIGAVLLLFALLQPNTATPRTTGSGSNDF